VPIFGAIVPVKLFFLGIFFANQSALTPNLFKTPYFIDIINEIYNLTKKKYFNIFFQNSGFFEKNVIILKKNSPQHSLWTS
jgi:hypothetical protein